MNIKSYYLKTFGCQMNHSDSEKLESVLDSLGLQKTEDQGECDMVIFNTCSIKQHAEDRVFGHVHNAKKDGKLVGLTGCMVKKSSTQNDTKDERDELLVRIEKIDFVFRIEDMKNIPELLSQFDETITRPKNNEFDELDYLNITPKLTEKFRAFVPIMTGCDKFCTYCVVPFTRGKERSRPFADIIKECTTHLDNGVKEITLVGQNVNAYFLDDTTRKTLQRQTDFAILLEEVAKLDGLKRLKFTSPHPRHMGDDILEVMMKYPNIARNIHLPVQSGSSQILQKMGREHNIGRFTDFTQKAREMMPDLTLTTDIIVGFCTESEDDFQKTMDLFDQEQFLIAYISKYSLRSGTFAGDKMEDDIPDEIKKERYTRLNEKLTQTARNQNEKVIGEIEEVLVESIEEVRNQNDENSDTQKIAVGKGHTGRTVRFGVGEKGSRFIGEIVSVKILSATAFSCEGEMV